MTATRVSERFVDAAQMFGDESVVVVPPETTVAAADMQSVWTAADAAGYDIVFEGLCIVLLFCIALLLRYGFELRTLISGLFRGFAEELESNRKMTSLTNGFFRTSNITAVLAITIVALKYAELWFPAAVPLDPIWMAPCAALAVVVSVAATALWQYVVLWMVKIVTGGRDFVDTLLYVKQASFSTVAAVLAPTVLLSALSPKTERWWVYVIAAECLVLAFIFLKETFVLFIRKKIPIFQWFLYLCTVEAFPITLIWASIARFR